jgi:[ribosomal protein S5]-alanine N-acetyltransferase
MNNMIEISIIIYNNGGKMGLKNLHTERLILIPFTYHISKALAMGSVKEVEELGLKTNGKWPRQDTMDILPFILKDFERNGKPTGFEGWMIVLEMNMTIIGDIGFRGTPDENGDVEIGYGIIEEEQGKGYGFEAAKTMVDWAFSQDKVKSIKADCLINNVPSIRILEKVGMKETKRDNHLIYWEISK